MEVSKQMEMRAKRPQFIGGDQFDRRLRFGALFGPLNLGNEPELPRQLGDGVVSTQVETNVMAHKDPCWVLHSVDPDEVF